MKHSECISKRFNIIFNFFYLFSFAIQNKTRGLLGTWSWDMADDLTLPDGRQVSANLNNFESTHRDFAMHCKFNVSI